jgi:hypothetical protein
MERAEGWMRRLEAEGIFVTSGWVEKVREVGLPNPREASVDDRADWASGDLFGVDEADVLWFLVPQEAPARGAYLEAGYALALGHHVVFSGDTKQSIFCALGSEYPTDEEGFDEVMQLNAAYGHATKHLSALVEAV